MNRGLISKLYDWGTNGLYSNSSSLDWGLGLLFILLISFLWSTVVRQTVD